MWDLLDVCRIWYVRAELDTVQAAEGPTLQHVRRVMWHTRQGHVLQERQECPGYILCAFQGLLQFGMQHKSEHIVSCGFVGAKAQRL